MESLVGKCMKIFLQNLGTHNCLNLFMIGWRIARLHIQKECYRYVQMHFEEAVSASKKCVGELPIEILKLFLKDKSLNITGERFIWLVIEEWVNHNKSERLIHVPELLNHMSLKDVDENLATEIMHSPYVQENLSVERRTELLTTNCAMLLDYTKHLQPGLVGPRHPSTINIILKRERKTFRVEMFLTYDENYDVWRKVSEYWTHFVEVLLVNHQIYIWKSLALDGEEPHVIAFDLSQDEFIWEPVNRSSLFNLVMFGGLIYVFEDPYQSKIFNPETNSYIDITPQPIPIEGFLAVEFNGGIYLIGEIAEPPFTSLMEVYWPATDTWSVAAAPRVVPPQAVVVFGGHLYGFGGGLKIANQWRTVEQYNPLTDSWRFLPLLPFDSCSVPNPKVFNGKLYVCGFYGGERRVFYWDAEQEDWKPIKESSPLIDLHLYTFCSIVDPKALELIVRRNRNTRNCWIKSSLV